MPDSNRFRVLYVDTVSAPHAQANVRGTMSAYRKVAAVKIFDYRAVARNLGPRVPWSRPNIWHERKWSPLVIHALHEMNLELVEEARWFRPDFIHLGKCELVYGQTAKALKATTRAYLAHFYGDLSREVKPWVASIGRHADVTLLYHKDPEIMQAHLDAGCNQVGFWWVGTDPGIFYPREVRGKDYDVIFMGRPIEESGRERHKTLSKMIGDGMDVHTFGGNWPGLGGAHQHHFVDEDSFAWACSRAKVALSINAHDVPMYASWRRIFNTMACGTLLLVRYFPGLATVFKNRRHLVWYKSVDEAVRLARHYVETPEEREQIAEAGRQEVLAKHTWDHRIAEMLEYAHV
jgi:hypothetical protein